MSETSGSGYVAAQVGALLGAALGVVVAFGAFQVFVMPSLFQEDSPVMIWLVGSAVVCATAAAVGCAIALRLRNHHTAHMTAVLLIVMLLVNVAAMTWSDLALQSALHPYLLVLALVSPLIARAVALRVRRGESTA